MEAKFQTFLQFVQENKTVAGYVVIGGLFLILLIFLFVKGFFSNKKTNALPQPNSVTPTPNTSHSQPVLSADLMLASLKQVSAESEQIVRRLETEIQEKEKLIREKNEYIQALDLEEKALLANKTNLIPIEKLIETEKKLQKQMHELQQKNKATAIRKWFVGFFVGVTVSLIAVGTYYVLVSRELIPNHFQRFIEKNNE